MNVMRNVLVYQVIWSYIRMRKIISIWMCYSDKSYVEITTKSEKLKEHMYDNQVIAEPLILIQSSYQKLD